MSRSVRKIHFRNFWEVDSSKWDTVKGPEKTHKSRGRCICYAWRDDIYKRSKQRKRTLRDIKEQLD